MTGRKRRCGWLDLVALRYTSMLNGATKLIMMKSDVMDTFEEIKVCVGYEHEGQVSTAFPFELSDAYKPVYKTFKGWKTDTSKSTKAEELPEELKQYIAFIEETIGVPVVFVSVGPDREQTILRSPL